VQELWDQVRALEVTVRDQDKKIAEYSQKKQETVVIVNPSKVLDQKYVRLMAKTQVLVDNIPGLFLVNQQPDLRGCLIAGNFFSDSGFLCKTNIKVDVIINAFFEMPG
jgi:hypothetical protein